MEMSPIFYEDFYKVSHKDQDPEGMELVYSNLTPRSSRVPGVDKVVVFGLQYFVQEYLIRQFNHGFFWQNKERILSQYKSVLDHALGRNSVDLSHVSDLHDLGYLPLHLKALPEGSLCPIRVPLLTVQNTLPAYFWLTNFIETLLCNVVWMPITSATISLQYRRLLERYAEETSSSPDVVKYQAHDFSFRGHASVESACASAAGHLLNFVGTDTVPVIPWLCEYYNASLDEELIGCSVPASEHSTMTVAGEEGEYDIFHRFLTEVYPTGPVSIVSDSYNLWRVLTEYLPRLKSVIMGRPGKIMCRPDSGNPVDILCGNSSANTPAEQAGVVQLLWDTFGGTVNSLGYKELDSHVGAIYGDSITPERCKQICQRLKDAGFASTNVVFGIGSYTFQYQTRDTFGLAFKATYVKINGVGRAIYKDPVTDDGTKKSAKGLLCVWPEMTDEYSIGDFILQENVSEAAEASGCLRTIFLNGEARNTTTLRDVRHRLDYYRCKP